MTTTTTLRSEPRPDKVAIVEEIAGKLNESVAVFVSEYRGMSVGQLADLRTPLRAAGAEHKVYKNTLARIAATDCARPQTLNSSGMVLSTSSITLPSNRRDANSGRVDAIST